MTDDVVDNPGGRGEGAQSKSQRQATRKRASLTIVSVDSDFANTVQAMLGVGVCPLFDGGLVFVAHSSSEATMTEPMVVEVFSDYI